ncbi:hypothetical protein [Micromonospora sp. WMMD975]|uniref:hypothetical protein n=1 Tax=Micromonospora sp. WMMD975 TaxID=3016087 RepID=UPI00249B2860|nr:hypothetical protein [Micromonospora sp. WMMD975]WFE34712.1 hypothetical protein O7613_04825 [Micromonospora sp. WMMD975]
MTAYARIGLPRWSRHGDPVALRAEIAAWATSPAMRDLVECFEERWPTGDVLRGDVLRGLGEISARHWDFRRGGERATALRRDFTADVTERVRAAVTALGLRHRGVPSQDRYEHVLIHGGLLRSCLIRARHAAALLGGRVTGGTLCGLGSLRPTSTQEQTLAGDLGVDACPTEFDAMDVAVRAAFPGYRPRGDVGASTLTRDYDAPDGRRLSVLAAPSSDPNRRANTADTCAYWADSRARPQPGERILLITTEHFVPFQQADAIRTLGIPYGCAVETVGVDPAAVPDARLRQSLTTAEYLQETRSAIRSMRTLWDAVPA